MLESLESNQNLDKEIKHQKNVGHTFHQGYYSMLLKAMVLAFETPQSSISGTCKINSVIHV